MTEIIPVEVIQQKIYLLRGQKIMLSMDLAELYGVETRALNQAVRRNNNRFPEDFMFALTRDEIMNLSQTVISSRMKHAPNIFAFTEQGVAMLSTVLKSERAVNVNIQIMRTFTKLRELMATHKDLKRKIDQMEKKYDEQFRVVFDAIKQLLESPKKPKRQIGFNRE